MEKLLKGIFDKLFKAIKFTRSNIHHIAQPEVEAIVDAKIKEHAEPLQNTSAEQSKQ